MHRESKKCYKNEGSGKDKLEKDTEAAIVGRKRKEKDQLIVTCLTYLYHAC